MIDALANHLWQSTVCAGGAGLLTLAFRRNRASVRHAIWFVASLKCLVPFALFIVVGGQLVLHRPVAQDSTLWEVSSTILQVSQPFGSGLAPIVESAAASAPSPWAWVETAMLGLWLGGILAVALVRLRMWRQVSLLVRSSTPWQRPQGVAIGMPVELRATPNVIEPCVIGWWRPVLVVPIGLENDLTDQQLEAVIAHEIAHIRRRDNLTAAIHMVVETLFWFHPVVWWIGAGLLREREIACDQAGLSDIADPQPYAEGLLKVCKRYSQIRIACVAGVSGANLRNRMEAIMTRTVGFELSVPRRVGLGAALVMGIIGPVIVGALEASSPLSPVETPRVERPVDPADHVRSKPARVTAQDVPIILPEPASFEVASVKPSPADVQAPGIRPIQGNRFLAVGITARALMQVAYGRQGTLLSTQVVSDVRWLDSERFDIAGISEALTAPGDRFTTIRSLLQRLLRDRFQAQIHLETRTLPIYELVMARPDGRPGPQLRPPEAQCVDFFFGVPSNGVPSCGFTRVRPGDWAARSINLGLFATNLAFQPEVGRVVRDRTGLQERFDLELRFNAQAVSAGDLSPDPNIFTALQEQLGLKLQPSRGPVEVLAIDRIERPTPD